MEKTHAPFHQSQFGYWTLIFLVFTIVTPLTMLNSGTPAWLFLLYAGFPLPIFLLFYRLTVTVDDQQVVIRFGVGLIKKVVPISNIQSSQTGRSSFWNGWGIRFLGNGTLYNIWGFQVVKLKLKDRTSEIWIGSPDNEALAKAIQDRMQNIN